MRNKDTLIYLIGGERDMRHSSVSKRGLMKGITYGHGHVLHEGKVELNV